MPAIFVQGQGWILTEPKVNHQNIKFHNQTFSVNLPFSFNLESQQNTEGFPVPFSNRIEIELDSHVLHPRSLRDVKWEWQFQYQARNRDIRYTKQLGKGEIKTQDNGRFLVELDTPNFVHPLVCQITLHAIHPSYENSIVSNSVRYQRTGIEIKASTEWNILLLDDNKYIEVSLMISNPFSTSKNILVEWEGNREKIELNEGREISHALNLQSPIPAELTIKCENGLDLFTKDNGIKGFQSSNIINLIQPAAPRILAVRETMVGDRQEFIVTLDKPASMLNCSAIQPHAEITKLRKPKNGGRTYAHHREEGAPKIELSFVEPNKNELFFTCAEKIGGGTYRLDFCAMMPNGEELDAKGIVFSVTDGTVDYIIKSDRIGQVHDHLEIYIELEFNSTAPDSFKIDFLPRALGLPIHLQKRLSFFSGHTHVIEPGLTVHTISLAIPLYCKEFVEMIEKGNLCFRIQSELEEFEFNPLNLDPFSAGEIICFAMYTPDWRDKENFKPSANHLKSELEKPRSELVYELQFQPHIATTLRAKLPPKAIDKVEVIKVRGGKKTNIQFVVPSLLDLQEHKHFFRNTAGIKRMIQLASEMQCMKEDEWYYLRIKAISEDLYDPLEVFIRTRFLVCDKHIFPSEYSIIKDIDFLPHIGNYALHRMKLTELAKDHDIPTKFFIPDEIFQGEDEIDSGVISNLDNWVAERKTTIDELEHKLASLDERISDK